MKKIRCKLSYKESVPWHMRPAGFICGLCKKFPETKFKLIGISGGGAENPDPINPKGLMDLTCGGFKDGDEVLLEVEGQCEVLASEFFRVAWENLGDYTADVPASKARLTLLIDEAFGRIQDPDLEQIERSVMISLSEGQQTAMEECCSVSTINDRLHNLSLPMLPLIAKHLGCRLQISFEVPSRGIVSYTMEPENNFELNALILDLSIEVGTRVTVLTWGANRFKANEAVKSVLQSLWQCDEWLRRRGKDWETEATLKELLAFADHVGRSRQVQEYGYVQNPFISNLLTAQHVSINPAESAFSKDEALSQLAALPARMHGLDFSSVWNRVKEAERKQSVLLRPGFAIAHAAMDRSPRLSITFGVYPSGVEWKEDGKKDGKKVNLIAMVVCALDTYGTWRDYLQKFAILFRSNPGLQAQLVSAVNSEEFLAVLRKTETSMINSDLAITGRKVLSS